MQKAAPMTPNRPGTADEPKYNKTHKHATPQTRHCTLSEALIWNELQFGKAFEMVAMEGPQHNNMANGTQDQRGIIYWGIQTIAGIRVVPTRAAIQT